MATTVNTNNNVVSDELLTKMNGVKKAAASTTQDIQDRFMTLLTTQMKNQDPLNPMDNAQLTGQLAQLSTVTGIEKLNSTLESLKSSYQSSQTLAATSMIGHGVLVPGSKLSLSEGKAILGVELTEPADALEVTIRDKAGQPIHKMNLGSTETGIMPLAWDGVTDTGATAADGTYTVEVLATRGGVKSAAETLTFGQVTSVTTSAAGVKLNSPGLGSLNMADVRQIM
jgi:flagellar basal-body rod modification protein FlgD